MDITVKKPSEKELKGLGVNKWPVWEKEAGSFDWSYDAQEDCYILEGEAEVVNAEGKKVSFREGDFVSFPRGLKCRWNIVKKIRKHYKFY